MQLILSLAAAVAAIWLVVGPVQEGVWLAVYRRDRLKRLRWNRRPGNPTGHWKGRYHDFERTPSGLVRREWNRVRAVWGRAIRGEPRRVPAEVTEVE